MLIIPKHIRPKLILLFLACFVLGVAVSIRTIGLPFVPLALIWIFWQMRPGIKQLLALGVAVTLPMLIFSLINLQYNQRHQPALSSSLGANLVLNYCNYKKVRFSNQDGSFWFSPPVKWTSNGTFRQFSQPFYHTGFYLRHAWECVNQRPQVLGENLHNITRLFDSLIYPYPTPGSFVGYRQAVEVWRQIGWVLLGLFVVFAWRGRLGHFLKTNRLKKQGQQSKAMALYLLAFGLILSLMTSVYLANPGEERYLLPYVWVMMVWGVGGVSELI